MNATPVRVRFSDGMFDLSDDDRSKFVSLYLACLAEGSYPDGQNIPQKVLNRARVLPCEAFGVAWVEEPADWPGFDPAHGI